MNVGLIKSKSGKLTLFGQFGSAAHNAAFSENDKLYRSHDEY